MRLLLQLARALDVSVGALVEDTPRRDAAYVSRAVDRRTVQAGDTSLQSLSDPGLRWLQAVELCLLPGRVGEPASHAGEEWIYVLAGLVEVDINGSTSSLAAGDAVHFRADVPHALHAPAHAGATVLVVNSMQTPTMRLGY